MINGTPADDYILGTMSSELILAGGGNDAINAGGSDGSDSGADTIDGGAGIDAIALFLSRAATDILYDAVAASTSTGITLSNGAQIKNVEKIGWLQTGTGNDTLKVSAAQGQFHWDAGSGTNKLIVDYSSLGVAIRTTDSSDGYRIESSYFDTTATHFPYPWFSQPGYALASHVSSVSIIGGSGNDSLAGTFGDDTLIGGAGNDYLAGDRGHDLLDGGAGDDTLSGDAGYTTMLGGAGNDRFSSFANDYADSIDGGAGTDSLYIERISDTAVNYNAIAAATSTGLKLSDGTVIKNMEHLKALYTGNGNDTLTISTAQGYFHWEAGGGSDLLVLNYSSSKANIDTDSGLNSDGTWGLTVTNFYTDDPDNGSHYARANGIERVSITGGLGDDILTGTGGDDTISGGSRGYDTMMGGAGNDTYYVDNTHDLVMEVTRFGDDGGIDRVFSTVDYTLPEGVENLNLDGIAPLNGTGNDLQNNIYGNSGNNALIGYAGNDKLKGMDGNDILEGHIGNDWLEGGAGSDWFVFYDPRLNGTDSIQDFTHGVDWLVFQSDMYNPAAKFTVGSVLAGDDAQFLWNPATHTLTYYDGTMGTNHMFVIATLQPGAVLDASDIHFDAFGPP